MGVTVFTPEVGTSPMPSIETVASVVRQVSSTWSPAEITVGVAVICAVGAGTSSCRGAVCGWRQRLLLFAARNRHQSNKQ